MTEKTKIKTITTTIFVAEDGVEFTNKKNCMHHEWKAQADKIYLVGKRGSRFEESEAYSSRELAEKYKAGNENLYIYEVCVNERLFLLNDAD